jgi:hypothetical protein
MALFGKKASTAPDASTNAPTPDNAASDAPTSFVDETSDPFASQAPVKGKGKGKKVREAAPAKSRGVKSGTVVGLNIGNTSIKAVEVTSRGEK